MSWSGNKSNRYEQLTKVHGEFKVPNMSNGVRRSRQDPLLTVSFEVPVYLSKISNAGVKAQPELTHM